MVFFKTIAFDHILFACFPKVSESTAQVRFEGIRVSERLEKLNQVGIIGGNEWPQIGNGNHDRNYMGLSENSVPLHPMVNDHYPY